MFPHTDCFHTEIYLTVVGVGGGRTTREELGDVREES